MKGKLLDFNIQSNQGVIRAENQQRYIFLIDAWRENQSPQRGMLVDFDIDPAGYAIDIYLDIAEISSIDITQPSIPSPTSQADIQIESITPSAKTILHTEPLKIEQPNPTDSAQARGADTPLQEVQTKHVIFKKPVKVQMEAQYSMMDWIKKCFMNYTTFKGRARRTEFWYFQLWCMLFSLAALLLGELFGMGDRFFTIFAMLTLWPNLAVSVRRLHDVNQSGWLVLISLIPFIGFVFLAAMYYIREGDPDGNSYGHATK